MQKIKVYLDTSVISYLYQEDAGYVAIMGKI